MNFDNKPDSYTNHNLDNNLPHPYIYDELALIPHLTTILYMTVYKSP